MRLSPDKTALKVNASLTLEGIPPKAFAYTLGSRSGIESDPNRADAPEYIVRLAGRVVTVSVETVKIIQTLPPLGYDKGRKQSAEK